MTDATPKTVEHDGEVSHEETRNPTDKEYETGADNSAKIERKRASPRSWLATTGLVLGYIASQEFTSLPAGLQTAINDDIGPVSYSYWIIGVTLLGTTLGWCISGPLGDQYGRRWLIIIGNGVALIGGIVGACAQHIYVVMVGILLCGLGSGGQLQAVAVFSETTKSKNRAWVQGLLYLSPFPFIGTSALVVGAISLHTTWRWAFYVNIVLTALSLVLTFGFYCPLPRSTINHESVWRKPISLKYLDVITMLLLIGFLVSLGVSIIWSAFGRYGWATAAVLVPLIMGFVLLLLIIAWCNFLARNALWPRLVFHNLRGFVLVILVAGLAGLALSATNTIFPEEITVLYTTDVMKSGHYQLTSGLGTELGVIVAGLAMRPIGHTNFLLAGSITILAIFTGSMAALNANSIKPGLAFVTLNQLVGGCIKTLLFVSITFGVPDVLLGTALSILNLAWSFGPAFGITFFLTVIRSRITATLAKNVTKAVLPLGLPMISLPLFIEALAAGNESALVSVPGINLEIIEAGVMALKNSYAAAFRILWFVAMGVAIGTVPIACFTRNVRPAMDDHVAAPGLAHGSLVEGVKNVGLGKKNEAEAEV